MRAQRLGALLLAQCLLNMHLCGQSGPSTRHEGVAPLATSWSLGNYSYGEIYTNQPFIGNGYMGLRIPSAGVGYWVGTKPPDDSSSFPLFTPRYTSALVAGYYGQAAYLTALPNWSPLTIQDESGSYDPQAIRASQLSEYRQSTDMWNGVVTTSVVWTSPAGNKARLMWTLFAHRKYFHLGIVRLDVTPLVWAGPLRVAAFFDMRGMRRGTEVRAERSYYPSIGAVAVSMLSDRLHTKAALDFEVETPAGISPGAPLDNSDQSGLTWSFVPKPGATYTFTKYVGIATGDDVIQDRQAASGCGAARGVNCRAAEAVASVLNGAASPEQRYRRLLQEHENAWHSIWKSDIRVDRQHGNLQAVIHASEYALYSSIRSGVRNSIAPAGLTSDNYAGMIFWDAETWMYPYLLAAHPEMAESIVNYRLDLLPNALQNVIKDPKQIRATAGSYYPWFSGKGILSVDKGGTQQIHLQADIALAQFQYYEETGDLRWLAQSGWPVLRAIADYYATRSTANPDGSYSIQYVDGPDEYTRGATDAAYTNGSAVQAIGFAIRTAHILGYPVPPQWEIVAQHLVKPSLDPARNFHLQYRGFVPGPTTKLKQADVVLLAYPMEYPMSQQQAVNDLNYYSSVTDPYGPSMTNSVQAVIAAQYGLASFDGFLVDSYKPYIRGPYFNFNETSVLVPSAGQGNPAFTFLTGAGGFLQAFLNGIAGYRFREQTIYLSPLLPVTPIDGSSIERVVLTGLHWQGRVFDVDVQRAHTTIELVRGGKAPVVTPEGSAILFPGVSMKVKTRTSGAGLKK